MWQVKDICRRELGPYSSVEDGETFEMNREGDPQSAICLFGLKESFRLSRR